LSLTSTSGYVIREERVFLVEPTVQQLLSVVQGMLATSEAVEVLRTSDSMNVIPTCNANGVTDTLQERGKLQEWAYRKNRFVKC
jgi:hypothetical protein